MHLILCANCNSPNTERAALEEFSVYAKDAFLQECTEVSRKQLLGKQARGSFAMFQWGFVRCELEVSKE